MIIWDSREENKHELKTFHLKYTSFQMVFTKYPLHSVTLNSDQNSTSPDQLLVKFTSMEAFAAN